MGKEQEEGKPAATKTTEGRPHECVLTNEHTHTHTMPWHRSTLTSGPFFLLKQLLDYGMGLDLPYGSLLCQ